MSNLKSAIALIIAITAAYPHQASAQSVALTRNSPYISARKQLISQGWQPIPRNKGWRMKFNQSTDNRLKASGIREFYGCNGIGNNICYFYFKNLNGAILQVEVVGGSNPSPTSKVSRWGKANSIQTFDF